MKVEGLHENKFRCFLKVLLAIFPIVIMMVSCSSTRKPDPTWAGTYSCIERSNSWDSPAHCILFEEHYALKLREDGTLAVAWSRGNCLPGSNLLAKYTLPGTTTGKWWSRGEHLFMELTLPLGAKDTGRGIRLVGLPIQVALKGDRTLLSLRQVKAPFDRLEKEGFEPPSMAVEYSYHPGFVFQDGSRWVENEKP